MAKRWYVLHVFSGSEKKAAQSIREQAAANGLEDLIEEVMVPTENVVEVKRGGQGQIVKLLQKGQEKNDAPG